MAHGGRWRAGFLVVGLVPGGVALRRLPISVGVYVAMTCGLALVALLAAVGVGAAATGPEGETARRVGRWARPAAGWVLLAGVVALAIAVLAQADARDELPPVDGPVLVLALLGQGALAAVAVHRRRPDPALARRTALAAGAVIGTTAALAVVGRSLPPPLLVPAVALVAARFALLPVEGPTPTDGHGAGQTALFVWSVATLAVSGRVLERPGGMAVAVVALAVGLVVVVVARRAPVAAGAAHVGVGLAAGATLLAGLFVLVPTEASMTWVAERAFTPPARFAARDERATATRLERWYDTEQPRAAALVDAHRGLGSSVSEWSGAGGRGIDGHVWLYRIDVRVWDRREDPDDRPPAGHPCRAELRACVLVVLYRSAGDGDGVTTPLRLPEVDPADLSPS